MVLPNNFIVIFTNKHSLWVGNREFSNHLVGFVDPTGHPPSYKWPKQAHDPLNVYCVKSGGRLMDAVWSDYLKDYIVTYGNFRQMFSRGFSQEVVYIR